MSNYQAGNLEIRLSALSGEAVNSLDTVIGRLSSLSTVLKSITTDDMKWISSFGTRMKNLARNLNELDGTSLNTITSGLSSLAIVLKSIAGSDIKWVSSFGTRMKNLAQKLNEIDWEKAQAGFNNLTTAITPFIDKIVTANESLKSLNEILTKVGGKKLSNLSSIGVGANTSTAVRNFNLGFIVSKFAVAVRFARRFVGFVSDIVQAGTDYTETLNMWQVAMRGNIDLADEFVKKMNKAYGIAEQATMNAQAVFKNMLSGLGNISDDVAYQISEAVTQMALDYASLYNVSFDEAFTKFQAALAGQVRPIRSVSGYDITQNTLQQIYEQLGGTKSVRSLSQTEKRLLSIYAIFQQMGESGALGDLTKTLDQFANQSRMIVGNWQTFTTWVGISMQYLLQQSGILIKINAALIVAGKLAQAFAYSLGYVDPDFALDWADNVNETSDALENLTGKLLDFDKFRALNNNETGALGLGIDQKLLDALSGYSNFIDKANNRAQELADKWLSILGLVDENNDGVLDITYSVEQLKSALSSVVQFVFVVIGLAIVNRIWKAVSAIEGATLAMKAFNVVTNIALYAGIFLVIYALNDLIKNWDKMTSSQKIARISLLALGVALTTFAVLTKIAIASTTAFTTALKLQRIAAAGLAIGGIGLLVAQIALLAGNWDKMSAWEKVVGIFGAVGAAALAAAAAIAAFHGSWTLGLGAVAIVGALAAITAAFTSFKASTRDLAVTDHATGTGDLIRPDTGTLFRAGEAGAEVVYTAAGGNTGVATVNQLKAAVYQALVEWDKSRGTDSTPIEVYLDGEMVYRNTSAHAKRRGEKWAH